MPLSHPTDVLLAHDRWANNNLLDACAQRTDEQLDKAFDMGVGSLRATITHMLGALRGWTDMLAQRDIRDRPEGTAHTIDQLRAMHDEASVDFEQTIRAHPLDEIVTGERGGRSYSFARGAVLTHVMTHDMHHRAQCLNMLRHLGIDPLPHSSVVEWMLMADSVS